MTPDTMRRWRYSLNGVGLLHTLLNAGIVFGWSSLEAVLRLEGTGWSDASYAMIFTCGAVGNYVSNLPFGTLLDYAGPKIAGCVASLGVLASGLVVQKGLSEDDFHLVAVGFFGLGFVGPGVQIPTLHLSTLFEDGAAAMSLQAAAFDGGALVFAFSRTLYDVFGVSSVAFFRYYTLAVPLFTLTTSILFWPWETLEKTEDDVGGGGGTPAGAGSPFLLKNIPRNTTHQRTTLRQMVFSADFSFLACFAAIHILKLNFVVGSVNAQTHDLGLVQAFGYMLPFGFISAPVTAYVLSRDPILAFELANLLGVVYGLAVLSADKYLLLFLAFPIVALSRQLVYSSVFHFIGHTFGFKRYGTLLGLVNLAVALFGALQYPLTTLSQDRDSYFDANLILLLITVPLFAARAFLTANRNKKSAVDIENLRAQRQQQQESFYQASEESSLLRLAQAGASMQKASSVTEMKRTNSLPR